MNEDTEVALELTVGRERSVGSLPEKQFSLEIPSTSGCRYPHPISHVFLEAPQLAFCVPWYLRKWHVVGQFLAFHRNNINPDHLVLADGMHTGVFLTDFFLPWDSTPCSVTLDWSWPVTPPLPLLQG